MKCQVFAATLLLAALTTPAHAGLGIARFAVIADALAADSRTGRTHIFVNDAEPYRLPFTLFATAQEASSFGAALQDKAGFFRDQSNIAVTEYFTTHSVSASATTTYHVMVSTDQPDTPLTVRFNFFGASAHVLAQYKTGSFNAFVTASIRGEHRASDTGLQLLDADADAWSILRAVDLSGVVTTRSVDKQGIGLPTEHFVSGYLPASFDYEEGVTLDAFSGTLDFGVLQPGEFFAFEYVGRTFIDASALTYTGRANVLLVDPFSLAQPPEFQFSIAGLQLPTAPVPEPSSALLILVGLGWMGWRRMR